MKYIRETLKYLRVSFWLTGLICFLPALVLAFYVKPLASITFLTSYASNGGTNFASIAGLIFNTTALKRVYPGILIFLTLFVSICVCLSVIQKHFRTGRLMLKKPLGEINDTFFPVLKGLLLLTAVAVVYSALQISLVTFSRYLIGGDNALRPSAGAFAAAVCTTVLLFIIFISFFGPVVFIMPLMITYGYSFTDALTQAFSTVSSKPFTIVAGGLFPFALIAVAETIISNLSVPRPAQIVCAAVMYLFLLTYLISYIMIVMFDVCGLERRDKRARRP